MASAAHAVRMSHAPTDDEGGTRVLGVSLTNNTRDLFHEFCTNEPLMIYKGIPYYRSDKCLTFLQEETGGQQS